MLLIAINCQLIGQDENAIIHTNYEFINMEMNFNIIVNGVDVSQTKQEYSIPINKIGFDTLEVSFNNNSPSIAIMKMKPNQIYQLNSNSCSMYVIHPKKEPKQGMVQFRIENRDTSSYLVSVDELNERKINRETIDEFYYTPPSANCRFSAKSLLIKSVEGENIIKIPFHFLHGELVGVLYDGETKTAEVNLFGYIRTEKDYRYKNDHENKR